MRRVDADADLAGVHLVQRRVDRKHLSRMGRQVLRSRNVTDEISHVRHWLVECPDDLL